MSDKTIHLGFEVGVGRPVAIPLKHLAIAGQTQEAGKTTALEALISRSNLRAVTFITKRGEASFTGARRILPYFREQADWQFVASVLEASRGEKLKFERAWIIRASKGARTLADVHRNVKRALDDKKIRGMSADVYLTLDAYLEVVVPEIARVRWATALSLQPGVNAVDLTGLTLEMQHLVIKSCLDWVLEKEEATVVVIPEAWKFIPQGRGTPVKRAADALIRQGAALGNYVWIDSQDLGGVDKQLLRHVAVWILGVQRETNEIKRALDNIPAGTAKPTAASIATLDLGQFFACWGRHAIKTYVQPAWLDDQEAIRCAVTGERPRDVAPHLRSPRQYVDDATGRAHVLDKEDSVTKDQAARLERENEQLRADNEDLRRRLEALEKRHEISRPDERAAQRGVGAGRAAARPGDGAGDTRPGTARAGGRAFTAEESFDNEALYQAIKARLIEEAPAILKISLDAPELEITVRRPTLTFDEHSMKWRLARLLGDGFLDEPKTCSAIRTALKRTGPDCNTANIGRAMDELVKAGVCTDEGSGYRAVDGMKVRVLEQ